MPSVSVFFQFSSNFLFIFNFCFSWEVVNWNSINRHLYKYQRVIFINVKTRWGLSICDHWELKLDVFWFQIKCFGSFSFNLVCIRIYFLDLIFKFFSYSKIGWFLDRGIRLSCFGVEGYIRNYILLVNFDLNNIQEKHDFLWLSKRLISLVWEPECVARYLFNFCGFVGTRNVYFILRIVYQTALCGIKFVFTINLLKLFKFITVKHLFFWLGFPVYICKWYEYDKKIILSNLSDFLRQDTEKHLLFILINKFFCELENHLRRFYVFLLGNILPFFSENFIANLVVLCYLGDLIIIHRDNLIVDLLRLEFFYKLTTLGVDVVDEQTFGLSNCIDTTKGFNFIGFYIRFNNAFLFGVYQTKNCIVLQPSVGSIKGLLTGIQRFLKNNNCEQVVLTNIFYIMRRWFCYYFPFIRLCRRLIVSLIFCLRLKLFYWLFRKYGRMGKKYIYKQYIKFLFSQFKFW